MSSGQMVELVRVVSGGRERVVTLVVFFVLPWTAPGFAFWILLPRVSLNGTDG